MKLAYAVVEKLAIATLVKLAIATLLKLVIPKVVNVSVGEPGNQNKASYVPRVTGMLDT